MTKIKIKRVYEDPAETDGFRVLVDRLWPRGMKKEKLQYDYWAKDIPPSLQLRTWFRGDVAGRWNGFAVMYQSELARSEEMKLFLVKIRPYAVVTLIYASKEPIYNHARILKQYLDKLL